LHTRFHHALGAMHLMGHALKTLQSKGHLIWDSECEAAQVAILLHDLGHGPFSHVLERTLLPGIAHESITLLLMKDLNKQFNGRLDMAIQMFEGTYPRQFFHQLISSQLDMDRMDYLNRDCFYTGVAEGAIGADRLIKMLDIYQDQLVVEEKGILSIENFLNARRLMYWQVYLHKTCLSAEAMLIRIIQRARELIHQGEEITCLPDFELFIKYKIQPEDFISNPDLQKAFTRLDDHDVWSSIKIWAKNSDPVISLLSQMLLDRRLFKIQFLPSQEKNVPLQLKETMLKNGVPELLIPYFIVEGHTTNAAYIPEEEQILVKMKSGEILDISDASELPTIKAISKIVSKYYVCWAKNVSLRAL
jgi:HD superfamily phosphohydrolase